MGQIFCNHTFVNKSYSGSCSKCQEKTEGITAFKLECIYCNKTQYKPYYELCKVCYCNENGHKNFQVEKFKEKRECYKCKKEKPEAFIQTCVDCKIGYICNFCYLTKNNIY